MIEELELKDFKNYREVAFSFRPGLNAIIGKNGRGKTNLLEAVYFILQGKTVRSSDAREMIRRGEEKAYIRIKARSSSEMVKGLELNIEGEKKERGFIEGIRAVMFHPDDLWAMKGGPEARRKQLDETLAEMKKGYRAALREYQRVLKQRNEAIRMVKRREGERELMRSWNPLLVRWGTIVVVERAEGIKVLEEKMTRAGRRWGVGEVEMKLYSSMGDALEEEKINRKLRRIEDTEVVRGMTLIGPHRDEVVIEFNKKNARRECSQGEQKLVAVMWKLAAAEAIKESTGDEVILLMDDCLSELDQENREKIIREMQGWEQVMLTHSEDLPELNGAEKIFLA